MSNKLIKRYKYIDSGTVKIVGPKKLFKNAQYTSPEYDQFYEDHPDYKAKKEPQPQSDVSESDSEVTSGANVGARTTDSPGPEPEVNIQAGAMDTGSSFREDEKQALEEQLKSQYDAQLLGEKQNSRNEGFQEGKQAGLAESAAEIKRLTTLVQSIQTEFQSAASKFFDEVEKLTMDMSVYLAKKIVGEAVSVVPDIIRTNVDKCVKLLAGSGTAQIKINPNDYDTIKGHIPNLEQQTGDKFTFVLEPDNKIERGGCMVEFDGSSIDGRIQTQIEKIQKQMEMIT